MAKSSVSITGIDKVNKLIEDLKDPFTTRDGDALGDIVVSDMKDLISKGVSPIKGAGRFERYKNSDKYPGDRKPARPVNLFLTGEFIDSLRYKSKKITEGLEVKVFYGTRLSNLKEQGHREGANRQPKRPTIPNDSEEIAVSIERKILAYIKDLLKNFSSR